MGNYSRNDLDSQRETEGDLESNGLRTVNPTSEEFMSLINTIMRENSELTIETAKMINNKITKIVTRKLDEIREDLNRLILEVINSVIAEKVLPSIQKVLGAQKTGLNSTWNHWSGRLDRSSEDQIGSMDPRSGRLDCNPSGRCGRADHRTKRPDSGPVGNFGQKNHPVQGSRQEPWRSF